MKVILRQKNLWFLGILFIIGTLISPIGCSEADSLGDKAPDEVLLETSPTWENSVKDLVQMKCALCHTVPPNDLTPDNAPADLDLRFYEGTEGKRGANILGSWINAGILDGPVNETPQMPLNYSTPLTHQEIEGLKTWVSLGLPEKEDELSSDPANTSDEGSADDAVTFSGNPDNGKTLYTSICATCHGSTGKGGRGPSLNQCSVCGKETDLMSKIETFMPPTNPTSCDADCAKDVAAYVLDAFN
jgi:cytochrome c5